MFYIIFFYQYEIQFVESLKFIDFLWQNKVLKFVYSYIYTIYNINEISSISHISLITHYRYKWHVNIVYIVYVCRLL